MSEKSRRVLVSCLDKVYTNNDSLPTILEDINSTFKVPLLRVCVVVKVVKDYYVLILPIFTFFLDEIPFVPWTLKTSITDRRSNILSLTNTK